MMNIVRSSDFEHVNLDLIVAFRYWNKYMMTNQVDKIYGWVPELTLTTVCGNSFSIYGDYAKNIYFILTGETEDEQEK